MRGGELLITQRNLIIIILVVLLLFTTGCSKQLNSQMPNTLESSTVTGVVTVPQEVIGSKAEVLKEEDTEGAVEAEKLDKGVAVAAADKVASNADANNGKTEVEAAAAKQSEGAKEKAVEVVQPTPQAPAEQASSGSSESSSSTGSSEEKTSGQFKDGSYSGSGQGRNGNIDVVVTVKDGKISNIEVASHSDTENLAQKVFRLISKNIIAQQSLNVDAVAGATQTSKGFIEAIKGSLGK